MHMYVYQCNNYTGNIDALYATAQKPTSTNRTNQTKTNTQFAVEHPSGSGSRNATEYYYETPVPDTRCHLQQVSLLVKVLITYRLTKIGISSSRCYTIVSCKQVS